MSPRTERLLLAGILLLALLLRLAYVLALRENPFFERPILDPAYHVEWARTIAAGEVFQDGAFFRAPLYPWFLGAVLAVLGDGLLVPRLVQVLLGVLTVLLTHLLARRAFGPREGLLAALLAATYWVLIYFDGEFLLPTLVVPLYLTALLATLGLDDPAARPRRHLLAGLAWGVATLARPNVLLLAPVLALWLLHAHRRLRPAALLALGWLVAVLPLTGLNHARSGELVLVSSQGGVNFWIGNHPGADGITAHVPGTSGSDFVATHREAHALAEAEARRPLSPAEVSRHYARKAWGFLLGRPGESVPLLLRKLALFWRDDEIGNNQPVRGTAWYHAPWMRFTSLPFWLLAPLGWLGLARAVRRRALFPLNAFVVVYCLSVVAFFVCSRFRVPILPALMVLAAHGVLGPIDALRARRRGRAGAQMTTVAAVAALLLLTGGDRREDRGRGLSHVAVGHDLAGEHERAAPLHARAVDLLPDNPEVHLALAGHLDARGDLEGALEEARAALAAEPDHYGAWNRYLALLLRLDRHEVLLREARTLVERAPGLASAHYHLGAAFVGLGRTGAGIAALEHARDLDPAGSRASLVLGQLYLAVGRKQEAHAALLEAVTRDGFPGARNQRIRAHVLLARSFLRRGRPERAREVARLLADREPDAREARALLAEVGG